MSKTTVGREPVKIIEIKQPYCGNDFAVAPCTASGSGDDKCYNTYPSCQDKANYTTSTLSLYFTKPNMMHEILDTTGGDQLYLIPSLRSASTAPTVINVGGSNRNASPLGLRAVLNVSIQDHPHNDRIVDPYQSERSWDAFARGSYWSKWMPRNKYYKGSTIIIYDGYSDQALDEMVSREYIIDSINGPTSSGVVSIVSKDLLSKATASKSLAPKASPGELLNDITTSETSIVATGALVADYDAAGTIMIGKELITFSAAAQTTSDTVTFTVIARGTDGTVAATHDAEDTVQTVLVYDGVSPWAVVQDLLENYSGIDASYIPITDWNTEGSEYLPSFTVTTKIPKPTSVETLVAGLTEQSLFYIWWHEVDKEIKMRAIRGIDSELDTFDDNTHILAGSFSVKDKPDRRISQVWTSYKIINPVDSPTDEGNYRTTDILADLDAETDNEYGEPAIKSVFNRWTDDRNVVIDFNRKLLNRFRDIPREVKFRVDAKDGAKWTGDVLKLSHFALTDIDGERSIDNWRIISAEAVVPGEVVEYVLDNATLDGLIVVYMDTGDPDYVGDGTDQFNGAWYADADGLMSNGDAGQTYA